MILSSPRTSGLPDVRSYSAQVGYSRLVVAGTQTPQSINFAAVYGSRASHSVSKTRVSALLRSPGTTIRYRCFQSGLRFSTKAFMPSF